MPKMIGRVLRSLLSRPATVRYPSTRPEPVEGTRGSIRFDMERCDLCQDCERVCPSASIKVFPDGKKIEYHPFSCIYCHMCVRNCMQRAIVASEFFRAPDYKKVVEVYEAPS